MITHMGIPVSPGVAIGEALVLDQERIRIPRRFVSRDAVEEELERLRRAVDQVADDISQNRDLITAELGEQYGAIFAAHLAMLRDPTLQQSWERLIRQEYYSPEHAVSSTLRKYAAVFERMPQRYLAERAHDVLDLERSLLRRLLGLRREELTQINTPVVVLAHDLTPNETASLDRTKVLGFATEIGGAGGHVAIVARALEIPAIVGVGPFLAEVEPGDLVIVDGDSGQLILRPDPATREHYQQQADKARTLARGWERHCHEPALTLDQQHVQVHANIEFPREVEVCLERGADGIGLYRTEFLYLSGDHEPNEEEHFQAYREVAQRMAGRPVVIRTLDLGADKLGGSYADYQEPNPFLGLRSIRLSLRHMPLFRCQLRAILRASAYGNLRIMFPMIATVNELRRAKAVLADAQEDLAEQGVPFSWPIPVGIMIEVPAAVLMLDQLLPEVDFVSIGTNDLAQYVLAVDRSNREVADLYRETDPAVIRLIDTTVRQCQAHGKAVSLCGQMSANPLCTPLLIGLGLRALSVPPANIPEIKHVCRSVSAADCQKLAQRVLQMESAREVEHCLREELKKIRP
ncbi:MAG: phosphoenolpyruvate-protein phosphotransferase [Pirellulaceae bacterium]|nr:MAG: phosphoenolpyruvate-protein phosphotransferase [Pirellulaceae bacterium]